MTSGQWKCGACGYFNDGPICTKCGKSVCISTTCPACGNGFIATDETPEFGIRERDERLAAQRVIEAARGVIVCTPTTVPLMDAIDAYDRLTGRKRE